jgi:hypothetical protein
MLTNEEKLKLKEAREFRCESCGEIFEKEFLDIHHQKVGDETKLVVLCRKCHIEAHKNKSEQGLIEQDKSTRLSAFKSPPVVRRKHGAGRPKVDRKIFFQCLALNMSKAQIKKLIKISERQYFRMKPEWDKLPPEKQLEIRKEAEKGETAKKNFVEYEMVQKWIQRLQSERVVSWKERLCQAQRVWLILQKKDPARWTVDDIKLRAIPELRKKARSVFTYLVSVRSLRPDFKPIISTKREKYPVNTAWKGKFEKLNDNNRVLLKKFLDTGDLEAQTLKHVHITLGCREGSRNFNEWRLGRIEEEKIGGLLGLRWEKVNWNRKAIDVYESKTGGGFEWQDCPLDLFGDACFSFLQQYWEQRGRPATGRIFDSGVTRLRDIYKEVSEAVGMQINPHMARKIHASLCHDADIPLEIVAGDAPHGLVGVGWEDLTTLKKFYLAYSRKTVQAAKDQCRQLSL